jgi:hypothetical protein
MLKIQHLGASEASPLSKFEQDIPSSLAKHFAKKAQPCGWA